MIKKLEKVHQIPPGSYQGYVWYSDTRRPEVLIGAQPTWSRDQDGQAFVVEALLYDAEAKKSYHVWHDGELHVLAFDLGAVDESVETVERSFFPSWADAQVSKLKFRQLWLSEKDPLCADMEVLRPKYWVFVGFEIKKQE